MTREFEGKSAIVTGAGSGIGASIARDLAAGGAQVIVADLDETAAVEVARQITDGGGSAEAFAVNVADPAKVEEMVARSVDRFGGLDLAVNNAGIGGASAMLADYPLDGWQKVIDVNLNGVFYGMKYQIAAMLETGGGSIVNMSSILGSVGFATAGAYVAAKHALLGLTRTAALEYAAKSIRVNAVGPGFIDTPLLSKNLDKATIASVAALHPVGRLGRPAEVSALTCFLLSDQASFINGSYHLVDGGYTAQ